jgi:hypothetical protein
VKRTQIQIQSEQLQWLRHIATEQGVSMAHLIRESIDLYRAYTEKSRRLHHQKANALNAVGSFSSRKQP